MLLHRISGTYSRWLCCRTDLTNSHSRQVGIIDGGKLNEHKSMPDTPWFCSVWRTLTESLRQHVTLRSHEPDEFSHLFSILTQRKVHSKDVYWIVTYVVWIIAYRLVKVKVKWSRYTPWRRMGWEEVSLLLIFNLGTRWGVSDQHHAPAALYPRGKDPSNHWTGGWVGPRAGLDAEARGKILCLCWGSKPGRPVRSQAPYWMSYPGS
jgi:hypothetical protein